MRRLMHDAGPRPSPAMVVAVLALFIALGGISYGVATGSIDSREIKNGSVKGKDVRDDSLTGADVTEASLGRVPAAGAAAEADLARDAQRLGGLGPESFLQVKDRIILGTGPDTAANYLSDAALANYSLDRGGYLVLGRVAIDNDSGVSELVTCRLLLGGQERDSLSQSVGANGTDTRVFTLMGRAVVSSGEPLLELRCEQPAGGDNDAFVPALASVRSNN